MNIQISKNPNAPYLDNPRGPHFTLTDHKHLREANGEDAFNLPLKEIVDYLRAVPGDKHAIEAMALISNNNGMALMHHLLPTDAGLSALFSANEPLVHKSPDGDFLAMNMERLALVLARNPIPEVRKHIIDFLMAEGIKPNMERINAEYCQNCGGK